MKVLVIGSSGFLGKNIVKELSRENDVYSASRLGATGENDHEVTVDLADKGSILRALQLVHPQAIVNCAGIVENNEKADMNPVFTQNLLDSVVESGLSLDQIVVMGSAAEYGVVGEDEIPVPEEVPPRATSPYGVSKVRETSIVAEYREKYHLPVVTARVFNPIGAGMPERQLIPRILEQIHEIKRGNKTSIEVSRLDSERDYIDVSDVALAIGALLKSKPKQAVYNIGSGSKTSNGDLVDLLIKYSDFAERPDVVETQPDKEPLFASQAEITRITQEFGWKPEHTIDEVVKEIVDADKDKQ